MAELVAHFILLSLLVIGFLIGPLLLGRFLLRPKLPTPEKDAIYECGEPTIGSSYIQFDLRFYVVALLFIIFDVEIAFFFPWSTIYGQANQLADTRINAGYHGGVIAKEGEPSRTAIPVRFQSYTGTFDGHGADAEDDLTQLSVNLDSHHTTGGQFKNMRLQWTTGELAGTSFRIRRYKEATQQLTLRDDLPKFPSAKSRFIIDDFSKYQVPDNKVLEAHWEGRNAGVISRVIGYDLNQETLTLAEPLPKVPTVGDQFVMIDPTRIALTEKMLSLPPGTMKAKDSISPADGLLLTVVGFYDILLFFVVLLVGFAYVWKRGDLDWVRVVAEKAKQASPRPQALLSHDTQNS